MISLFRILQYIAAGLGVFLLFGLSVLIHEFGHFIVARLLGMRADTFAIGFGPAIWKTKKGDTEYRINWIPFGGYVSLPQLDPAAMANIQGGDGTTLPPAPWWKRILVAFAGPFGNIVLGLLLALIISTLPWNTYPGFEHLGRTTIGWITPNEKSEKAGLQIGDTILAVGDIPVDTIGELYQECHLLSGNADHIVPFTVSNSVDHTVRTLEVPLSLTKQGYYIPTDILMSEIVEVNATPTEEHLAGLDIRTGDRVLRANGELVYGYIDFTNRIAAAQSTPMQVEFLRNGTNTFTHTLTPQFVEYEATDENGNTITLSRWVLGLPTGMRPLNPSQWLKFRNPIRQIQSDASSITRVLGGLFAPKHPGEAKLVAQSLGGPLTIFVSIWQHLLFSLAASIGFIRFLNINLAMLNLLPIPVLDGGHILFALFEGIFRRKLPKRLLDWTMNFFVILILALFAILFYRDILRLFNP